MFILQKTHEEEIARLRNTNLSLLKWLKRERERTVSLTNETLDLIGKLTVAQQEVTKLCATFGVRSVVD